MAIIGYARVSTDVQPAHRQVLRLWTRQRPAAEPKLTGMQIKISHIGDAVKQHRGSRWSTAMTVT
jgi:DNA invertase Pin-like site-specific DNA recombinase